jgi:hypothetical protein
MKAAGTPGSKQFSPAYSFGLALIFCSFRILYANKTSALRHV